MQKKCLKADVPEMTLLIFAQDCKTKPKEIYKSIVDKSFKPQLYNNKLLKTIITSRIQPQKKLIVCYKKIVITFFCKKVP